LSGLRASPILEIACQDVAIKPVDLKVFDELFPGWDQPSRGLARPMAEAMYHVNRLTPIPAGTRKRPNR